MKPRASEQDRRSGIPSGLGWYRLRPSHARRRVVRGAVRDVDRDFTLLTRPKQFNWLSPVNDGVRRPLAPDDGKRGRFPP
jgi:hypothetical protein